VTLHQALQAFWRVAGEAILWSSALVVMLCVVIALAAWRRGQHSPQREGPPPLDVQRWLEVAVLQRGVLDLATEAEAVLESLQSVAMRQRVRLEMALEPGLAIMGDQRAFRETLAEIARGAIQQSPCGCVLLTAARTGGRVHASVSDDGPGTDKAMRLRRLRDVRRLVALQGGCLEINVRPGEGTTVTVHLPGSDPGDNATDDNRLDPDGIRTRCENRYGADNIAH
jgi:hypothetical protein